MIIPEKDEKERANSELNNSRKFGVAKRTVNRRLL